MDFQRVQMMRNITQDHTLTEVFDEYAAFNRIKVAFSNVYMYIFKLRNNDHNIKQENIN